jgi:DNA replication ATP-dependent helicase Dna2
MYGLKGNVDATVQVQMQPPDDKVTQTLLLPLELKTGARENVEAHRAQTALYTLLLTDRYDIEVTYGILYYMETSKTYRIEGVRHELRQMIIWRNMIAGYVHNKLALPPVQKREHLCRRCYAQTSCFTYHKLLEGGNGETSGVKEIFDEAVGHLQPQHQTFFHKWDELLTREERDCMKFRRELWTMLSTEREQVGRCFANMTIEPGSATENLQGPKINRFVYSFIKQDAQLGQSLLESQITVGEPIVISDEKGHFALANGFVTHVRPNRVTVAVDRRLQNARKRTTGFDAVVNQSFVGIMNVGDEDVNSLPPTDGEPPVLYRIDKDEFSNGMATVRNNLIRVMEKGLFRAKELRELIIDLKAPVFKHTSTAYQLAGPASQQNINIDQRRAIDKVMTAKDFALVLGMPGTGKTTTIAHIIRALVSQNKSVLLTSYTHTAVDNILLKIKDDNIPILRLGAMAKIHQDIQSFADLSSKPKASLEELERSWQHSKVVATTCLGINHGIFNHRIFDYCIVDEASQITLPVCLGPIRFAHTFILVGDHYQLPPLVQNKEAQEGGLDVSLFKLLSDVQPQSVVTLEHQYRMAEDIMSLSNALIYDGRLKCGTEAVATRTLQVPNIDAALEAHHSRTRASQPTPVTGFSCSAQNSNCWLRTALRPLRRVVFLNTDNIASPQSAIESVHGGSNRITNPTESLLTAQLLTTLIRAGVPAKSIGVITFYRSQLALLKRDVKSIAGTNAAGDVEMHTADKYQGRDKEVILLCSVRSNEQNSVGELLKDWRRVNVAITRARSKLIVIGSHRTLMNSNVPVLQGLCRIMKDNNWLVDLPPDPINGHVFARAFTQTQAQTQERPLAKANGSAQKPSQQLDRPALAQLDHNVGTTVAIAPAPQHPTRQTLSTSKPSVNNLERDSMGYSYTSHVKKPFKAPKRVVGSSNLNLERVIARNPIMADVLQDVSMAGSNNDNFSCGGGGNSTTRITSRNHELENELAAFAEFFEDDDVDF